MSERKLSRRDCLKLMAGATAGGILVACTPEVETVEVEKVVKETVEVEKVVEQTIEVEKVVTVTPGPRTEVRYWGNPIPQYSGEHLDARIAKFEETHPGIKVIYEPYPDEGQTKFLAQAVAGTAPDIIEAGGSSYWQYIEAGVATDLKPYVSDLPRVYFDDWPGSLIEWLTARDGSGSIWGLPYRSTHMVLIYNRTLFDEVGVEHPLEWDHADYLAQGSKFLQKDDSGKLVRWGGHSIVKATKWLENKLRAFDGYIVDPEDPTRCALGDDEAQEALEWLYKCIWEDNMWPRTEQMENYWWAPFDAGTIATQETASWILAIWADAIGDRFKWDFAPYPKGPRGTKASAGAEDCWITWSGSEHPQETWEVLKWLVSDEMEIHMMESAGSEPGRRSLYPEWYRIVREKYPQLADTNLEAFEEPVRQGYEFHEGVFKDNSTAMEILNPALELFIDAGEAKPDYFRQVADEITASQQA